MKSFIEEVLHHINNGRLDKAKEALESELKYHTNPNRMVEATMFLNRTIEKLGPHFKIDVDGISMYNMIVIPEHTPPYKAFLSTDSTAEFAKAMRYFNEGVDECLMWGRMENDGRS